MSFMSRRRDKTVRAAYLMIGRLKEEIQKAVKKERYLSKEDAKLISEFILKIQKEINEAGN